MSNQTASTSSRGTSPTLAQGEQDLCCGSVVNDPLSESAAHELALAFAALADPVRLRLLNMVAQAGEICSCDLQGPLAKSQPTISHHTKILAEAGLISGDKRGRWVWWSVDSDRVAALRNSLAP